MTKSANKSYCPYLWTGLSLRDGESLYPCCRFELGNTTPSLLTSGSPEEIYNSDFYKNIRNRALSGEANIECQKCSLEEEHGIRSDRLIAIDEESRAFSTTTTSLKQIRHLEAFIGRTCNLKCHGCHPQLSTKWEDDYKKAGWDWVKPTDSKTDYAEMVKQMPHLQHIKIIGGEPALSKETSSILHSLSIDQRDKVTVEISTNGTVLFSEEVLDTLSGFKKVDFNISVDGFDKVNELIRFPSKWNELEKNIDAYIAWAEKNSNIRLILHCTVSALNIFSLSALESWWQNKISKSLAKSPRSRYAILTQPEKLHIGILPSKLKQLASQRLLSHPEKFAPLRSVLNRTLSDGNDQQFPELLRYCRDLDDIRKTDTHAILPELFQNS